MTKHEDEELELDDEELEDELDDIIDGHGSVAGFAMGLVVGALLGAGAALLMAPQRGEVTRKRLRRRIRHMRDDAAGQVGEWRDDARRELRRQRKRLRRRLP